jgi:pimeloyl-ACP methyl ester carboxylesterase
MRPTAFVLSFLLVTHLLTGVARAESPSLWGNLEPGRHDVGFRILEETDRSRAIRPGGPAGAARSRPVRVYVWYPATLSPDARPMTFGRLAELADEDVWPDDILTGARERMAYGGRPFARSLGEERFQELLKRSVRAVEDAQPAASTFPLIVIGQGLYYESPLTHAVLGEFLASHGFVVATCPLVGTHSPLVRLDVIDLETQVRDMEFVIARVQKETFVSRDMLGLFGFDMGGMSAVILAMRNPDVDAFVSVDAGILYGHHAHIPSGIPFTSPHFDPLHLRTPWLHATQREFASPPPGTEGSSLFDDALHADRSLVLIDGMRHADFTSYALVPDREPIRGYWPPEAGGEKERYEAVCQYVLAFFRFHLAGDEGGGRFLARDPAEAMPGIPLTIEHRPAVPPGPVHADFLNALLTGNPSAAGEIAAKIRASRPQSPHFEEPVLIRLGYHLLSSWGMSEEGIAVFRLNTELHPQSVDAWYCLGDGYLWVGDHDQAAGCFRRVLELDPDNAGAKRNLDRLSVTS